MGDFYGKSIINGVLQYASVSAVKMYDPHTKGGCPRRWGFTKIGGKHEEESQASFKAKQKGLKLDAELKNFLRTGEKNLSPLALKGLHMLELPGPGLRVDLKIHKIDHFVNGQPVPTLPEGQRYPEGHTVRIQSQLTAAGVPFVGELDFAHDRGHYRDDDGVFHDDPPDTVEVADIKFKSNAKDRNGNNTLMLPTELYRDIQMAGYGEWVARVRFGTKNVRLSHLYYIEKGGQPTKVTRLHVIDDCRRTWEYVDTVVADMKAAASETDLEHIPGNVASCDSFGGCPHREYCTAYRRTSLDSLYGKVAQDFTNAFQGPAEAQAVFQHVGATQSPQTSQERASVSRSAQEFGDAQNVQSRANKEVLSSGPGEGQGPRAALQLADGFAGLQFIPGAVSRAATFSERLLPDLPPTVFRDQNEIQPANAGTLSQHYAFSWRDVPDLQSSAGVREGQPDLVTKLDQLPRRAITMGLLSNNPQIMQQPAPAQAPAQPDMRAQLAEEEARMRQQAAQQQQQMPQQVVAAQLADVCARISAFGIGFPALGGNAALAYAAMGGQSIPPGFVYNGIPAPVGSKRSLHALQLGEPAHLMQLLGELEEERAKQQPQLLPQPAPSFTQQLGAAYTAATAQPTGPQGQPLSGPNAYTAAQVFAAAPQTVAGGLLPPGAPQSMPQLAVQQAAPTNPPVATAAAAVPGSHDPGAAAAGATAPRKRGRPANKDSAPEAQASQPAQAGVPQTAAVTQAPTPSSPAVAAPQVTPVAQSPSRPVGLESGAAMASCSESGCILVNARFGYDRATKSLAGYVDYINEKLARMYNTTSDGRPGPLDVRTAVEGSILGFGGWKGAVRTAVKAEPPPADSYHFDTFMNELNEIVADALREVAEAKGWMYIRGVR